MPWLGPPTRLPLFVLNRVSLAALAVSTLVSGCNFTQAGTDPVPGVLNYPIAIELYQPDPTLPAEQLIVANSNFDLRFNTGSVQVYDIPNLDAEISECGGAPGDDCIIEDGDLEALLGGNEVGIGSHADGMAFNSNQTRLYLPVRTGRDLTWIDFDPAAGPTRMLQCDQQYREPDGDATTDIRRCSGEHVISRREAVASERELNIIGDPVALAVIPSSDVGEAVGDFILMALRDGRVALFLDDDILDDAGDTDSGPELIHVASGFPDNIVTITVQPNSGIAWLTAVGTDDIARVGLIVDRASPARSFLYNAGALRLGGIDDGEDTRDFQFHPTRDDRAFVLARRPESVVEVDLERRGLTAIDLGLRQVFEVGAGPSRLTPIDIDGRTYVLASCYDAQRLFVIDIDHGALVSVVGGFSGPFELVVDRVAERLYVVDFIVSVIRIVDLSPLRTGGEPTIIATIGKVIPPRTLLD